jgi:gliding motility-associated-like protein
MNQFVFIKNILLTLLILSIVQSIDCQAALFADYRLDNCSVDDYQGNNDGFILGNPCVCGVRSQGFQMNGSTDFVEFSTGLNDVFRGNFSLSFYAQFDPLDNTPMDVFSLAASCQTDSVFLLRYIPDFNQIRIVFSDSPDNTFSLNGAVTNPSCWTYFVFTKEGSIGSLYIDEVLVDQQSSISPLALNVSDNLSLANSPCSTLPPNSDTRFRGSIDEIQLFSGVLSQREVINRNLRPDKIISKDTTIFIGESMVIQTGGTCASQFVWNPSDGLSSSGELEPIASPTAESTTYTLTVTNGDCIVTDDITINVVDRDRVTCTDLMLPSAFTPNGDGINDEFGISNLYLVDELNSFEVFNKWGGRVFGTRTSDLLWNGLLDNDGDLAPNSSFLYKVSYTCDGQQYLKSGTVVLIR